MQYLIVLAACYLVVQVAERSVERWVPEASINLM